MLLSNVDMSDDEDENEEADGGNRFLGFMFGNVDNSGDLDADYLDEVDNPFMPLFYDGYSNSFISLLVNLLKYVLGETRCHT